MTPSLTIGGASCASISPVEATHTGRRRDTFSVLIWANGLYPQPLYVRRIVSQSPSSGFSSRSAVTGEYRSSVASAKTACAAAGAAATTSEAIRAPPRSRRMRALIPGIGAPLMGIVEAVRVRGSILTITGQAPPTTLRTASVRSSESEVDRALGRRTHRGPIRQRCVGVLLVFAVRHDHPNAPVHRPTLHREDTLEAGEPEQIRILDLGGPPPSAFGEQLAPLLFQDHVT